LYKSGEIAETFNIIMKSKITESYIRGLVSKNLRRLRSVHNISQLGLAVNAGLAHNFINDIENCKKGISAKTLAKLSAALDAEPYQFFLPDNMSDNNMMHYVYDFNDSLQKVVKELTQNYLVPGNKTKP
jgi:transcriptional regulator with XRE-family HTH domain